MTLNNALIKQNVISSISLEGLSKELKVKLMRIRIAYNKIKSTFDADCKEFTDTIVSDEMKELASKENRTPEETSKLEELNNKANSEYQEFLMQKGIEDIENIDDTITESEFYNIVENAEDVTLNGTVIKASDFMELIYNLFVK